MLEVFAANVTSVSPRSRRGGRRPLDPLRSEVERVSLKLGRRLRFLVGKPGLDGHSDGAEQIAARTDAGMDVVYDGIRLTPAEIVEAARSGVHVRRPVDPVGLAYRAHRGGADALARGRARTCAAHAAGGIVPPADAERLKAAGVAAVYTPKDFEINSILRAVVQEVEARFDAHRVVRR